MVKFIPINKYSVKCDCIHHNIFDTRDPLKHGIFGVPNSGKFVGFLIELSLILRQSFFDKISNLHILLICNVFSIHHKRLQFAYDVDQ